MDRLYFCKECEKKFAVKNNKPIACSHCGSKNHIGKSKLRVKGRL